MLKGAAPSPASLGGVTPSWSSGGQSIYGNNFREDNVGVAAAGDSSTHHSFMVDRRRESFPSTFGSGKNGGRHHQSQHSKICGSMGARRKSENGYGNDSSYNSSCTRNIGAQSSGAWNNSGTTLRDGSYVTIPGNVLENRPVNDTSGYASANGGLGNGAGSPPMPASATNGVKQKGLDEKMSDLEAYVGVLERKLSDAREAATDTAVAATAAAAGVAVHAEGRRISTDSVFAATSSANGVGYGEDCKCGKYNRSCTFFGVLLRLVWLKSLDCFSREGSL